MTEKKKTHQHFQAPPIKWPLYSTKISHSYNFLGEIAEKPNILVLKRDMKNSK